MIPAPAWHRIRTGPGTKGTRHYDWAMIEVTSDDTPGEVTGDDTPGVHEDGHSVLLARRHRYTGTLSFYRCWTPGPVPLSRLIAIAVTRWRIEIGHRCCRSSWIQVSFLSFLSVVCRFSGFFLGWRPAGAVVVAGRAVPALAELVQLFLVGEDDPVPAAGAAAGGDPAAVDPVVDAGGGHAELGGQVRDGPLARVEVREDGGAALGVLADAVLVDDVEDLLDRKSTL